MDLHEFLVTPQGQAYVIAVSPVSHPSVPHKPVFDSVVQEIDIKTGLVEFEWHALDHVPLSDSYFTQKSPGQAFDPYHANSVGVDRDGNLIVSMRNTSAVYKINRVTGQVIWRLGGKHSSFKMGRGTAFAFQHDVRVRSDDGTVLTVFDDGAGPPTVHSQSRAITLRLDHRRRTATLMRQSAHSPGLLANYEGNTQLLDGGDQFVGWGQQPYFTEFDPSGHVVFDGRFVDANSSYRVYRYSWVGTPQTPPSITASTAGGRTVVYASWNGATEVSRWQVLAGPTRSSLRLVASERRTGFETAVSVKGTGYHAFAVRALNAAGQALGTSPIFR
jgi:hypothetical protein